MSRLTDLIAQVSGSNAALADDLRREVEILSARRPFGLNFERHVPELVNLSGREVRRGDKVAMRQPSSAADSGLFIVVGLSGSKKKRLASIVAVDSADGKTIECPVQDLIVVAEFRDSIYPGLRSRGSVERNGEKPTHVVINGENFHALEALNFVNRASVDCIYIDPPYNTRDKDWKYNNDYVDSDDAYRHSKWLAMMERRLKLARRLLNPANSVLIVTIDEREYLRLGLLLEQMFPDTRIQMVTSVINPNGVARGSEFSRSDEYLFFVFVGDSRVLPYGHNMLTDGPPAGGEVTVWDRLMRRGTDAQRQDSPRQFYPFWIEPSTRRIVAVGDALPPSATRDSVEAPEPGLVASWPIRSDGSEGRWKIGVDLARQGVIEGTVKAGAFNKKTGQWSISYLYSKQKERIASGELEVLGKDERGALIVGHAEGVARRTVPVTTWNQVSHNAASGGSNLLRALLPGRKFPFPKSLYAVEDALRFFVADKPNATILDFFAGSGTTAHAVMRLNRQDGGRRRSILVTNNEVSADEARALSRRGLRPGDAEWEEFGVCKFITQPRIEAAITGTTPDGEDVQGSYRFTDEFPLRDGFSENVEFFDLSYEDPERVRFGQDFEAIAALLWMRAGSSGRRIGQVAADFDIADTYGVLFEIDHAAAFVQGIRQTDGIRLAYIVTDDESQFQTVATQLPGDVESVRLYSSYLENFQITAGD